MDRYSALMTDTQIEGRRTYLRELAGDVFKNVVSAAVIALLALIGAALTGYVQDPEGRVIAVAVAVAVLLFGGVEWAIWDEYRHTRSNLIWSVSTSTAAFVSLLASVLYLVSLLV
jgi:hypothetical protein